MRHNAYVSADEVISDIAPMCADPDFRFRSQRGYLWYVQQALQELGFDTFFDDRNEQCPIPENLKVPMPKGSFNIRNLYAFNGTKCVIDNSQIIYWKRNFIPGQQGAAHGYVARNKPHTHNDPFFKPHNVGSGGRVGNGTVTRGERNGLYYYNVVKGIICLSESCLSYQNIFIQFDGTGGDMLKDPVIPEFFRQAVIDWVCIKVLRMRLEEAPRKIGALLREAKLSMYGEVRPPYDGSWYKAEYRVKTMDSKEREDLNEYLSRASF